MPSSVRRSILAFMSEEVDIEQLGEDWPRIREDIKSLKADMRELAEIVKLLASSVTLQTVGTQVEKDVKEFRARLTKLLEKHSIPL